ncbi:MAG TPA: ATP-dependent RNA helicase [Candidatus Polarisedimenticolaceae bacterium]|nr:ATP-dependent RNA helicase [Candidatus Polarisedimenticolaceae bacterium]
MKPPLPIDPHLAEIRERLDTARAVVVVAPPGAGKTTRVPPAVATEGPVIVLQPRRLAARSLAARIAVENGWTLGEEVGWQVRLERRFTPRTRILVATEGILTARLQSDPLLGGFRTVVLDEFHERSIHADLALALAREAWRSRPDLRIAVMSATLDPGPVAAYLDDAPVVTIDVRTHPVDVAYEPGTAMETAIADVWQHDRGHVLAFLPGAPEIRSVAARLSARSLHAVPLHGRLSAAEQDAAIAEGGPRRIVLATNVAETSLTVPGVTTVVDSGLQRLPRFDPALGIDRLVTERIPRDAADQRAGRAGRTAPGRAVRLWDPRDERPGHREPEIARIDLAAPLLDLLAWGGAPETFPWFEPPPAERVASALDLLRRLGAVENGRLTPLGRTLSAFPLPPRLARVLVAAGGSRLAAAGCAVLSERFEPQGPLPASASDVLARADRLRDAPREVLAVAREIASLHERLVGPPEADDEERLLRALLDGFPDRLARRRSAGSPRLVLANGHGAVLDRASVVHGGDFLLAIDVEAASSRGVAEARVRMASVVEESWLPPAEETVEHRLENGRVRAYAIGRLLTERAVAPDPAKAEALLRDAFVARGITPDQAEAAARLRFAGIEPDLAAAAAIQCAGASTLAPLDLLGTLGAAERRTLEKLAPATMALPSGRTARLHYRDDGSVVASVKLQELFGLAASPRLGARGEPVVLELLAPNGRPVQTTRDLRSFWDTTYPAVRRELRGRYPRHPWPEDPWTAPPTHRVKPR